MSDEIKRIGYFEGAAGERSMGRLLSFIACLAGVVIFAGATVLALWKGADVGPNVLSGCMALVGIGIAGKAVGAFADREVK